MPRFHIESDNILGNTAQIKGYDFNHIVKVLRMRVNDNLVLFDSKGFEYNTIIKNIAKDQIEVLIIDRHEVNTESPLIITLFQSIAKGDKMDFIVQKATELGVNDIYPVVTKRSEVKNTNKISRWQKIADESIKQCGRIHSPRIHSEIKFEQVFDIKQSDLNIIFYESERTLTLRNLLTNDIFNSASLIIGPEGGFTDTEVSLATENGFKSVGLGKRTLRSETASIAAITLIQHYFGDI